VLLPPPSIFAEKGTHLENGMACSWLAFGVDDSKLISPSFSTGGVVAVSKCAWGILECGEGI
jgi:hypothetical protein